MNLMGRTISHYLLGEKLGGGGMGEVYRAEDTRLHRTVALKFLPLEWNQDPEARRRFTLEAQSASSLDHPSICTVYDIDETAEGQLFIVMAYCEGESLKQRLERGPLELREGLKLGIQVADGLARAHAKGIIHRDIKPANLMLSPHGDVKIVDFGLAKLAGSGGITATGVVLGTAHYLSPEQALGKPIDGRTDLWSLGMVLYECICSQRPFGGDTLEAAISAILHADPAPPSLSRPEFPNELDRVLLKTLEKDPNCRHASAEALRNDLENILQGLPNSRPHISGTEPTAALSRTRSRLWKGRRGLAIATASVLIAFMAAAVLLLWPSGIHTGTHAGEGMHDKASGINFVWIPPGMFTMGSPETEEGHKGDEGPQHHVKISQGFWIGKYEVTQGQYEAITGTNPSEFKEIGPSAPVENVSWEDTQTFLQKLNQRGTGQLYRLPTEAEWEYACRAGTTESTYGPLNTIAWHFKNSSDATSPVNLKRSTGWFRDTTHPVGQKQPNPWGVHDMLGNVWEWCQDWYRDPYDPTQETDPVGPATGRYRAIRGGSWMNGSARLRSAYRGTDFAPEDRYPFTGFRVVCVPAAAKP